MSIFSSIGKVLGGAARIVGSVLPGPAGALATGVGNFISPTRGAMAMPPILQQLPSFATPFSGGAQGPVIRGPSFSVGGGGLSFSGPSYQGPSAQIQTGGGNGVPSGYHINKALVRAHVSPTPGNQRRAQQVVHQVVKNQHMNVLNPRALKRAERRAKGFIRFARKIVKYYQPKAPKGRAYIRSRKR